MSRIFLGHSSAHEAEAIALRDWLVEQGWSDFFLDLDPERGLEAGQCWQEALKQAAERSAGFSILVQLVARYGDEATLFRLSAQLERARPWFDRKPPVAG